MAGKHDFLSTMKKRLLLFDGAFGSMLIARDLSRREVPEAWIASRQQTILEIHEAYIESGADIVTTATFGANRIKLSSSESGRQLAIEEINQKAVEIARKAIDKKGEKNIFVAGDMGPTGQFFPPLGTLRAQDARSAFREQAKILDKAGVDLLLIETMYDLREAVEALRGAKEGSTKPVILTMTFERRPRGFFTLMGDTPEQAVEILQKEGADATGANCTLQAQDMVELAEEFRLLTDGLLLFQPNAGQPEMEHGLPVYKQSPDEFAEGILKIVKKGANAVGGCCGTTPDFIRAAHDAIVRRS